MAAVMYIYYRRHYAGADAGFRVRGGASGVSRISARCLRSGPIQKVGGGGGGGLQVRYTKSGGGGGGGPSGPIYEKWGGGGGGGRFRSDIRKVEGGGGALQVQYTKSGGGGGGGGHSASGPIPLRTQKISTCTYLRAT